MFKKNSWIVALLLVLSLSVFMIGCVDPIIEEEDTMTYSYKELGVSFNTWGGQAYQSGWSTDGASWSDPDHAVKNLGLTIDDFTSARYLELELNVESLAGGLDVIWGNEGNGWNQTNAVFPGGAAGPLKIDLTKLTNYAKYKASAEKVRIILQYNQSGQVKGLVKSAKLAIPDSVPFVPVKDITLPSETGYQYTSFIFNPTVVAKENKDGLPATNAEVIWSIVSFAKRNNVGSDAAPTYDTPIEIDTTNAGTIASSTADLLALVDFQMLPAGTIPELSYWDYTTEPWTKVVITPAAPDPTKPAKKSNTALNAFAEQGKLVMKATIVDGIEEEVTKTDGTKEMVKKNFTKPFTITVGPKLPVVFKVAGVEQSTLDYGAADNAGVSGSKMIVEEEGSYIVTYGGSYGNSYSWFRVDFGAGKTFSDFGGITFKYQGVSGDFNYKPAIRVKANTAVPPAGVYAPGDFVSWTGSTGDITEAKEFDAKFGWNEVEQNTTTNIDLSNVAGSRVVYFWIYTNADPYTAKISEIEFYEAVGGPIATASATVTAPVAGAAPAATATPGHTTYTVGTVAWTETVGGAAAGSTFAAGKAYTAKFTLTKAKDNTFTGMAATGAITVAGAASVTYTVAADGNTVAVTANYATLPFACGCDCAACLTEGACTECDITDLCFCDDVLVSQTFTLAADLALTGTGALDTSVTDNVLTVVNFAGGGLTYAIPAITISGTTVPFDKFTEIQLTFLVTALTANSATAENATNDPIVKLNIHGQYQDLVEDVAGGVKFSPSALPSTGIVTINFNSYGTGNSNMSTMDFTMTLTEVKLLKAGDVTP